MNGWMMDGWKGWMERMDAKDGCKGWMQRPLSLTPSLSLFGEEKKWRCFGLTIKVLSLANLPLPLGLYISSIRPVCLSNSTYCLSLSLIPVLPAWYHVVPHSSIIIPSTQLLSLSLSLSLSLYPLSISLAMADLAPTTPDFSNYNLTAAQGDDDLMRQVTCFLAASANEYSGGLGMSVHHLLVTPDS